MRRRIIYFLTIALLFFGVNFFVWNAKLQTNPFTMEQILNAITRINETSVNDRKVLSDKILEDVRQRGVAFPLTKENEILLRSKGITTELIEAIRQNSPSLPTPIPTPILKPTPVSTPIPSGEAVLEAYSSKQYERAIFLANTRLSVNPKDSQTLTVLAQSYFMKDDFDSFAKAAVKAIEAGGRLEFSLRHHHSFYKGSLHPVSFVITEQAIFFDPQISQLPQGIICPNPYFSVSLDQLVSAELVGNLSNEIYLKIVFTKSNNPKKTTTMRFADRESYFVTEVKGVILYTRETMVSRQQAIGAMRAIESILNIAKTSTKIL